MGEESASRAFSGCFVVLVASVVVIVWALLTKRSYLFNTPFTNARRGQNWVRLNQASSEIMTRCDSLFIPLLTSITDRRLTGGRLKAAMLRKHGNDDRSKHFVSSCWFKALTCSRAFMPPKGSRRKSMCSASSIRTTRRNLHTWRSWQRQCADTLHAIRILGWWRLW